MGADFIAVAVDVSESETYWLREIADHNDAQLVSFLASDRVLLWEKYFHDEANDRNDVVKTLRCDLITAVSCAYDPGRDATWLHLDGKTWAITGEHSWGDVGELFESYVLFDQFQSYVKFNDKYVKGDDDGDECPVCVT
jgi:hypothetical protein